jgi:hypothetical protein
MSIIGASRKVPLGARGEGTAPRGTMEACIVSWHWSCSSLLIYEPHQPTLARDGLWWGSMLSGSQSKPGALSSQGFILWRRQHA